MEGVYSKNKCLANALKRIDDDLGKLMELNEETVMAQFAQEAFNSDKGVPTPIRHMIDQVLTSTTVNDVLEKLQAGATNTTESVRFFVLSRISECLVKLDEKIWGLQLLLPQTEDMEKIKSFVAYKDRRHLDFINLHREIRTQMTASVKKIFKLQNSFTRSIMTFVGILCFDRTIIYNQFYDIIKNHERFKELKQKIHPAPPPIPGQPYTGITAENKDHVIKALGEIFNDEFLKEAMLMFVFEGDTEMVREYQYKSVDHLHNEKHIRNEIIRWRTYNLKKHWKQRMKGTKYYNYGTKKAWNEIVEQTDVNPNEFRNDKIQEAVETLHTVVHRRKLQHNETETDAC